MTIKSKLEDTMKHSNLIDLANWKTDPAFDLMKLIENTKEVDEQEFREALALIGCPSTQADELIKFLKDNGSLRGYMS